MIARYAHGLYKRPISSTPRYDDAYRFLVLHRQHREYWCPAYVSATYRLWFLDGLLAGDEANLAHSMRHAGQNVERVLELADSKQARDAYEDATSRARDLGVFGSPSFIVGDEELFWGDGRHEDAIDHARRLAAPS